MSAVAAESSDSASSIFPCLALSPPTGRNVVGGGELLADACELGRLVVAALPVQDIGKEASRSGDVIALAHLLEPFVVRPQLRLGGGQIAGKELDNGRAERREGFA